jgi:hypothetical protein
LSGSKSDTQIPRLGEEFQITLSCQRLSQPSNFPHRGALRPLPSFSSVAFADAAVVLAERDIEAPM